MNRTNPTQQARAVARQRRRWCRTVQPQRIGLFRPLAAAAGILFAATAPVAAAASPMVDPAPSAMVDPVLCRPCPPDRYCALVMTDCFPGSCDPCHGVCLDTQESPARPAPPEPCRPWLPVA